jgi:hypothetical protein
MGFMGVQHLSVFLKSDSGAAFFNNVATNRFEHDAISFHGIVLGTGSAKRASKVFRCLLFIKNASTVSLQVKSALSQVVPRLPWYSEAPHLFLPPPMPF